MSHEAHHHEEKQSLSFFASPLVHHTYSPPYEPAPHTDIEQSQKDNNAPISVDPSASNPGFKNRDCAIHNIPAFRRHAEATTAELFYDLFFVANLTTFTSMLEINDRRSLTAYVGFFSLLWLTWYQVSLYDVRFSADSVFERWAKTIHFGVMVGFAVIGPQWKPGQEMADYKIYKAFGLMLMVSRLILFFQYSVTMIWVRKYKKTVVPLAMVMGSTLLAAVLYGVLTPAFPKVLYDATGAEVLQKSNVYVAWYVIALSETILTVTVSCVWRIISFKGTHLVQRMSLLTLIVLGEGIIVICKSISKIVKNEYLWTVAVVGQILAAVCIIYFLYMLYFDRITESHFGSIRQQIWSFLHFPLHIVLVLVLQGISLLIIWRQAVECLYGLDALWLPAIDYLTTDNYTVAPPTSPASEAFARKYMDKVNAEYPIGIAYADYMNMTIFRNVYNYIPKGVDASKELKTVEKAYKDMAQGLDNFLSDRSNSTAEEQLWDGFNAMTSATYKTLFDTFSVTIAKRKLKKSGGEGPDPIKTSREYYQIFDLIMCYTFVAGGIALILYSLLGLMSLARGQRGVGSVVRLAVTGATGLSLGLVPLIRFHPTSMHTYLGSAWMIPTICLALFFCVLVDHVGLLKKKTH